MAGKRFSLFQDLPSASSSDEEDEEVPGNSSEEKEEEEFVSIVESVVKKQESVSIVDSVARSGLDELAAKQGWARLSAEDKQMFEEQWKLLQFSELKFYTRKIGFIHEVITKMAEAFRSNP